jgi:hypothetical protein
MRYPSPKNALKKFVSPFVNTKSRYFAKFISDLYSKATFSPENDEYYKVEKAPMMSLLPGKLTVACKHF